jgi:ankyrin repeat protein
LLAWVTFAANAAAPRLVQAVKAGNRQAALTLARDANEVAATEADGTTALHWAVRQNDYELVDRMLRTGADVNAANRYGVTPLKLAAINGEAKLLKRLLDSGGDANAAGADGETLLMTAARGGHVDAARVLIQRGAEVDAREGWHGQTALMWAAAQGHPPMLRELIAHGADVNARSNQENWERQVTSEPRDKWLPPGGLTPLLFAARENCLDCLPVLIEAGADIDALAADDSGGVPGGSALLHAAVFGMTAVVDVLVAAGARIRGIEEAAAAGDIDGWLTPDTDPQARIRSLVMAADHQRLDVIDQLVVAGTPIDAVDEAFDGHPLRTAATNARPASVRHLLSLGADPHLRDDRGRTALDLCRRPHPSRDHARHLEVEAMLEAAM